MSDALWVGQVLLLETSFFFQHSVYAPSLHVNTNTQNLLPAVLL